MVRSLSLLLFFASTVFAASGDGIITDPERVLIFGAVKHPGPISVTADLTLTKALQQAGGFGDFADHHILIWRSTEKRFIKANEYAIRQKQEKDPLLRKGDVIIIGQRYISQ